VHTISWTHESCEIGYWIAKEFEGRGYISETVKLLEDTLFQLGFHRIEIRCSSTNQRSAAVPKRLGYRHEGTLIAHQKEFGQWRDTLIFAKLRP
jgi:RimJ/RimL family protein N-acetyltransferase